MAELIEVVKPQPNIATQNSATLWELIKSLFPYLFWLLIILGLLTLLAWWLIKKIKESNNIFYKIHKERKRLCKMHRDRFRTKAFFKFRKNHPIKCIYHNSGKLYAKTVGYYRGHFYSSEKNLIILFNWRRKWLVFPRPDMLIINKNPKLVYQVKKQIVDAGKVKVVEEEVEEDLPTDIEQFTDNEIFIYAYGIDMDYKTQFFYPVLKDKQGRIISMSIPTYQSLKNVAIGSYLYDQTDSFVKITRKAVDMNVDIRGKQKLADSSQSVETSQ